MQYLCRRGLLLKRFSKFSLTLGKPSPQFGVLALECASPIVHHRQRQGPPSPSQLWPACDDLGEETPVLSFAQVDPFGWIGKRAEIVPERQLPTPNSANRGGCPMGPLRGSPIMLGSPYSAANSNSSALLGRPCDVSKQRLAKIRADDECC